MLTTWGFMTRSSLNLTPSAAASLFELTPSPREWACETVTAYFTSLRAVSAINERESCIHIKLIASIRTLIRQLICQLARPLTCRPDCR
ncbi:hypothetical protein BN2475_180051 [Paraburkholderia ribeironis]|uniref:Uncharacterized protein n=1 Tax=Paraburkholderia ribeironis TaxID=1247936 RepID=A0A1N7RV19_9BURK|nr:hypothetical protein BN2475_180051 [Paraburkholderia ribeironis]